MFERLSIAAVLLLALGATHAAEPPLRDPMQPFRPTVGGAAQAVAKPRYALTAVLISTVRKVAVVNGRPVREGGRVDGAEIVRIEPTAVHLRDAGRALVIPLGSNRAPAEPLEGDIAQ